LRVEAGKGTVNDRLRHGRFAERPTSHRAQRPSTTQEESTVNKSELIAATSDASGLSKQDVSKALDGLIESISGAVTSGEKVTIAGFGTFERRERSARTGRNPQTGEEMEVAASKAPAFKPAKNFKDQVNN